VTPDPFACLGCGSQIVRGDTRGWLAYLTEDTELAVYCPSCAKREFGGC
jgi:hypothetical protein